MKNFPLPSFFKIRLVVLIIGFFVVCFLLGAAKHLYAVTADDCPEGLGAKYCPQNGNTYCIKGETFDLVLGWYGPTAYPENPGYCGGNFYWISRNWTDTFGDPPTSVFVVDTKTPLRASPPLCTGDCSLPDCTEERIDLATQCGGDDKIMNWDDQTCTGECKPDCSEAYANLLAACGGRQYIDWFDDETCLGECVTCEDVKEHCESLGFDTSDPSVFQCTDEGWIEPADDGGNFGQYWHIGIDADEKCGFDSGFDPEDPGPDDPPKDPPPPDPPADRPCAELQSDCIERCNGHVKDFQCTEGGTYRCQCTDDANPDPTPNPGDPGETPPDPGDDAPPGTPGGPDGTPDGTNDNELLGKISTNTKNVADNTKRTGDILQTELNKLNATGKSMYDRIGTSNQWLSQIEAALNTVNGWLKKIEDALDDGFDVDVDTEGIEERLDDIKDIIDDDYTEIGSGNPTEAYSPTEEEFNIGERFDTFISRIRNTGVFALPNDFFNAPPSGGSPIFTFEFGSYGTRTVDLSDMSQPLLILRTIVLIAFCFVCLRVVILKR